VSAQAAGAKPPDYSSPRSPSFGPSAKVIVPWHTTSPSTRVAGEDADAVAQALDDR
jgi:hypothetical protein